MAAALHFLAGPAGPGQLCHIILSQPVWHSLIPSWRCSPSRFSAPGLAFQGHMLLSGAVPMAALPCSVRPTAGAIWALSPPWASRGTAEPGRGSFVPHVAPMSLPGVLSPRTVAPSHLRCLPGTASDIQGCQEEPVKGCLVIFAVFKQTSPVLGFFGAPVHSWQCCSVV